MPQGPIQTPAGASASAAGILTLILQVILPPIWPWWGHQSTTWTGAVSTVILFVGTYLASYYKVVRAKKQHLTLALTNSRWPTVQEVAVPGPPPAVAPESAG